MISQEDISRLATLARIDVDEAEVAALQSDVSTILEYIGQINAVAVAGTEVAAARHHNVFRADVPRSAGEPLEGAQAALLAQLPRREGEFAVVRKIIQKDE